MYFWQNPSFVLNARRRGIPGLPPGWRQTRHGAVWEPEAGYEYHIEPFQGRWEISFFGKDASTGDRLRVFNIPASVSRSKLGPERRGEESIVGFVHAFDAADAAMAHWQDNRARIKRIYEER